MTMLQRYRAMGDQRRQMLHTAVLLAVVSVVVVFLIHPSFSASAACRRAMASQVGYGPWKELSPTTFSDGYNTADCGVISLGPFWWTTRVVQTEVACVAGGIDAPRTNNETCPLRTYGLAP